MERHDLPTLQQRRRRAQIAQASSDVIVTAEGDVLVADPGAHRVYLVEDNQLKAVAGSGDGEVAPEDAPSAALPTGDATEVDLGEPVALAERDGTLSWPTASWVPCGSAQRATTATDRCRLWSGLGARRSCPLGPARPTSPVRGWFQIDRRPGGTVLAGQ